MSVCASRILVRPLSRVDFSSHTQQCTISLLPEAFYLRSLREPYELVLVSREEHVRRGRSMLSTLRTLRPLQQIETC